MITNEQRHAFGRRLRLIRKDQGLRRKKMSARYLVSCGALRRYEAGKKFPDAVFLTLLSLEGYNLSWLLTGEGEMAGFKRPAGDSHFKMLWFWVLVMSDNCSAYKEWFRIELEKRFREIKEWRERNDEDP